jgi:hypothetical protein
MDILVGLGKAKTLKYTASKKYNKNCVALLGDSSFLQLSTDGANEIIFEHCIEPLIPFTSSDITLKVLERFVILISGNAGDGKSLLASLFVKQYEKMHPNRSIYRISLKPMEDDRNFKLFKKIINVDIQDLVDIETIKDVPRDSLFIVDDADNNKDVYRVLDILTQHGRERGVNIIFITHYNSKCADTSIYKECNIYITFHNNMVNNRMLETHFKIDKKNIEFLKALNQTIYLFNKVNQTLICNNFVCKLNSLRYDEEEKQEIIDLLN